MKVIKFNSGTVINYGSGSDFLTNYGSGSGSTVKKVTVPTGSGSGSTTLPGSITNDTTPDAGIVEAARDYLGSSDGGETGALSWLAGVLREEAADRWGRSLTLKGLSHERDSFGF
jgi:hypothetical protein